MATKIDTKKEIAQKSIDELKKLVHESREALRAERFKDKFSRKAGLIKAEKQKIARALTELRARGTHRKQS